MNETYFEEVVDILEQIFTYAHKEQFSLDLVEKEISKSAFFQLVEKPNGVILPFINDFEMIYKIFGEYPNNLDTLSIYKQCAWAAESYCYIQKETRLTFEAIFLYIPISKMYEYFLIYHEMDYSHIVNEFKTLFLRKSVLDILLNKRQMNMKTLSKKIGISYASIFSYKKRRRDIKKMSAEAACILANIFDVRIETILEFFI